MIRFNQVGLQRGRKVLFENVEFTLHRGERIGVTGANGTGKSSLFSMLLGELAADNGEVDMPSNLETAHVRQETPSVDAAALEYVIDGDRQLRELEVEIAAADEAHLGQLYAKFEAIDGYTAASRAGRLLHGLGFTEEQHSHPVKSFSGGWRMRLNLAQALMCRSDLLLLDEPTNHLDMEAVIWLEQWLKQYEGTLLLISHDREFLDRVVNRILHLEQLGMKLYRGNYSDFEIQRAEQLAQQQAAHEKQQKEMAHLHKFVERFRAKASKAKQAQSRVKALERMEVISAAHVDSEFSFEFQPCGRVGDPLLKLDEADLGYGETAIVRKAELQLRPGSRVGLLGPNGAGKSTLIKSLAGELPILAGECVHGNGLKIGYFAQHQLDQLDLDASALQQFQRQDPQASEQTLRNHLGGFGFKGERADEIIRPFSGGEKSRLALAMLIWQKPNLLLLDEPTNHLDLEMRHALTIALQGYAGALVIVSHDRHLLRTCTDELFIVHGGCCELFSGDLDDYRKYISEQEEASSVNGDEPAVEKTDKKSQRRAAAELRKQLQPLTSKLKKIEKEMQQLQEAAAALETKLADEAIYQPENKSRLQDILTEKAKIDQTLPSVEENWLELSEEIEELSQQEL